MGVKFMVEETNATGEKENSTVLNIINQLGTNLETENSVMETPSQDDYAVYVTDDEAAKLAFETVQELAELDEDQCYELANDTDDIVLEIKPIEEDSENHLIAENLSKESTEVNALQKEAALND